MSFWKSKRVVVTGGSGFLGSHLVTRLKGITDGAATVVVPRRKDYDLVRFADCERLYADEAKCPHWRIIEYNNKKIAVLPLQVVR